MSKFLATILLFLSLFLSQCVKSEIGSNKDTTPKAEISEAKKFVLGKWESAEPSEGAYYLIFSEDNLVIQELYGKGYNGQINRYGYKINENNEIEIEQNYETNLIVKKINENEFELKPKQGKDFLSPPILFFFTKFQRVSK